MTGFLPSANGRWYVAGDGPNGHVPFSCLEVVVAAEDVTSVAEKEINERSKSSFEWEIACAADSLHAGVLSSYYVGIAVCIFDGMAVGVAVVSCVVVRTLPSSVAWRLAWRFTATLPASLTPSTLLLVLLFVPLLSLLSLLLVLGAEGIHVLEMARAFAVVANYVSADVFCRGHGSPAPRNPRRRARTGKVGRIGSRHHAVNVVDPKAGLLEMGCTDTLVLRRKSLADDVLELTVRGPLWRVAPIEAFAASIELAQDFVRVLARTHSRGVHFSVLRSERYEHPSNVSQRAAHARCPCPDPSSSVLPAKRRTKGHAAPFVVKNGTLYRSSLAVFQAASFGPSMSGAADGTGAPCKTRKMDLS